MNLRTATSAEIKEISSLYMMNWKKTYKNLLPDKFLDGLNLTDAIKKWEDFLSKEKHIIFVAYEEDQFLGFSACREDEEIESCWYLDSLHVSENTRGKGVGTRLIEATGKYALCHGYSHMSICIVKGNDSAKHLYEKKGARHYKDFTDFFGTTKSASEKLIWDNLQIFR